MKKPKVGGDSRKKSWTDDMEKPKGRFLIGCCKDCTGIVRLI